MAELQCGCGFGTDQKFVHRKSALRERVTTIAFLRSIAAWRERATPEISLVPQNSQARPVSNQARCHSASGKTGTRIAGIISITDRQRGQCSIFSMWQ